MVILSLLLSGWLVASAFVLPHTLLSGALTACAGVVALAAVLPGRAHPLGRFLATGLALAVSGLAVLGRAVPDAVALHHAVVAPLLLLLALRPLHPLAPRPAHAARPG